MWPVLQRSVCGLCYRDQYVACATEISMWPVLQRSVCGLCYRDQYVACATEINMWPVLQRSVCGLCYRDQYVACATEISMWPVLHRSVCGLCYRDQYVACATDRIQTTAAREEKISMWPVLQTEYRPLLHERRRSVCGLCYRQNTDHCCTRGENQYVACATDRIQTTAAREEKISMWPVLQTEYRPLLHERRRSVCGLCYRQNTDHCCTRGENQYVACATDRIQTTAAREEKISMWPVLQTEYRPLLHERRRSVCGLCYRQNTDHCCTKGEDQYLACATDRIQTTAARKEKISMWPVLQTEYRPLLHERRRSVCGLCYRQNTDHCCTRGEDQYVACATDRIQTTAARKAFYV
ncbi:hypothetical protein ACOMHN_037539 [Nucella lapillus]